MPAYFFSFELGSPGAKPQELNAFARCRSLSQEWGPVGKSGNKILVGTGIMPPYEPNVIGLATKAEVQGLLSQAVIGLASKAEVQGLLSQAVIRLATKAEVQGLLSQAVIGLATKAEVQGLLSQAVIGLATKAEVQGLLSQAVIGLASANRAKWLADGTGAIAYADESIYSSYPPEAVLENHSAPYWYHNSQPKLAVITFFVELPEPAAFEQIEIRFFKDNYAKTVSIYNESGEWLGLVNEYDGNRALVINGAGQTAKRFRFEFSDKNTSYVAITSIQIF